MKLDLALVPLPLDGLTPKAARGLARFCVSFGTRVQLLHAHLQPAWFSPQYSGRKEHAEEVQRTWLQTSGEVTQQLADLGVEVSGASMVDGAPRDVIVPQAEALGCDIVAIPRRHRGSQALGRTAKRVLRTATTPVLALPAVAADDETWLPTGPYRRLLVPTDFSAASEHAIRYSRQLGERCSAGVSLIHAADDPRTSAPLVGQQIIFADDTVRKGFIQQAQQRMAALVPGAQHRVVFGRPAEVVVEGAADNDLIVIAATGKGAAARVLLGSTTERLVQHSPVPVLVLRANGGEDTNT